jgi:hypothetical protein
MYNDKSLRKRDAQRQLSAGPSDTPPPNALNASI